MDQLYTQRVAAVVSKSGANPSGGVRATCDWKITGCDIEAFLEGKPSELFTLLDQDPGNCFCKGHLVNKDLDNRNNARVVRTRDCSHVLAAPSDPSASGIVCDLTPAERLGDIAFVRKALDLTIIENAFVGCPVDELVKGSVAIKAGEWGKDFCYMPSIVGTARRRVGRVLGPGCLALDLIRVLRIAGRCTMPKLMVLEVERGLHVVRDPGFKGQSSLSGAFLVHDLMTAVRLRGDTIRVGMDGALGAVVQEGNAVAVAKAALERQGRNIASMFFAGDVFPTSALVDLGLAARSINAIPTGWSEGKLRYRKLALLGDRVCKLMLAERMLGGGTTVEDVTLTEARTQSDKNMADRLVASDMASWIVVGAGVDLSSAKVGGTIFEAIVGAVFFGCGMVAADRFVCSMGLIPGVRAVGLTDGDNSNDFGGGPDDTIDDEFVDAVSSSSV